MLSLLHFAGQCTRQIKQGDTFWALSILLGTTLESVLSLNPNVEPTVLQINQIVNVPCQPVKPPLESIDCSMGCSGYCTRSVLPTFNGTCAEAAEAFSMSLDVFANLNKMLNCAERPDDVVITSSITELCVDGTLIPSYEDITHPDYPNR